MIEQLIDLFDAAVTAPVATKHGLAILGPDGPMRRTQAGQYTPIAVDNEAPWSYWRIGDIKSSPYDIYACSMGALQQVPLRLVLLLPNDCGQRDILLAAGRSVTAATGAAKELLGAARVRVVGQRIAVDGVAQTEKISNVPLQWSLIAIDMDLEVIGTADCLVGCGDGPSVLCSVITTATNADVVECLGDRIIEICESGPSAPVTVANSDGSYAVQVDCGEGLILPDVTHTDSDGTPVVLPGMVPMVCTPGGSPAITTVNGVTSDVPDITVVQGGVEVGTLDPVTGIHTVPVCPPAGDGSAVLKDTGGNTLSTTPVPPATSVNITAPDALVQLKDSAGSNIGSIKHYRSGSLANIVTAPDGQVQPRDSGGTAIGAPVTVRSAGTADATIPDASVQIKDSALTDIGPPLLVLAADSVDFIVSDSTITLPDGQTKSVRATQPYTVPQTAPLKFAFGAYDQGSDEWTVTADEAGAYSAYTQDGASGTVTYSLNGGAFAALSGTVTLAIGNTIQTQRTTYTAAGWSRWQRQVTP